MNPPFDFAALPENVIEEIFSYLDGRSILNFSKTSSSCKYVVELVLSGRVGSKFWKKKCFKEIPRNLMLQVIKSYHTVVYGPEKLDAKITADDQPYLNNRTWMDVFTHVDRFQQKILQPDLPLKVTHLTKVEEYIKNEVIISFREKESRRNPRRYETTSGSFLIHVQTPCSTPEEQAHVYIFENMTHYVRGHQAVDGREKVRSITTMDLPIEVSDIDLPKIETLCVVVTDEFLTFSPLHRGACRRIPFEQLNIGVAIINQNRFAIQGNYVGIWSNPNLFKLFVVSLHPVSNDAIIELILSINVFGIIDDFWTLVANAPDDVCPIFESMKNPFITSMVELPRFGIVSPTRSYYVLDYGDIIGATTIGTLKVIKPRVNPVNKFCESRRLSVGNLVGHKIGCEHVIFWSSTFVMIQIAYNIWIYEDIYSSIEPDQRILQIEEPMQDHIILGTDKNIYFIRHSIHPPEPVTYLKSPTPVWTRGRLQMTILQQIPLLQIYKTPTIEMTHMRFDFDKGKPYIFLSCDYGNRKDRTARSFEMVKIEFEPTDEELDDDFGFLKEDEFWKLDEVDYISY